MKPIYRSAIQSLLFLIVIIIQCSRAPSRVRQKECFCNDWKFKAGDADQAQNPRFDDSDWRRLNLPHDWSIEGQFSPDHPATPGGGALPGGTGWYRKMFQIPESARGKCVFVDFDGIYMNSDVWINGHYLGKRPNGYISFRYDLTPHVKFGEDTNVIAVKVDNSLQPNSRWYSGSGIYRNVRLVMTDPVHVELWGTYVTTPEVNEARAAVAIHTTVRNATGENQPVMLVTEMKNSSGKTVGKITSNCLALANDTVTIDQQVSIRNPDLWTLEHPCLYKAVTTVFVRNSIRDDYVTSFGIRKIRFDAEKGFFLNDIPVKIKGVCNHHDLGCLGSALNIRALERQLEIMKAMGVNSLRTSHNPPAPELLDLCDRMGIMVQDEMFDMWKKPKSPHDYSLYWDAWHEQDLKDFILRDRNHPCIITWSIGNEILEQWDSSGTRMARELAGIVRSLDSTRPITSGCNDPQPGNFIIQSGSLDLIGYNYKHKQFESFPETFPGQKFIATETNSGLATRGHYDMPSDSLRIWPERWDKPFLDGNPDNTCSAYDHCRTPWGSTQEATWKIIKKHDFLSGLYIWTGFDYLGEPTPYNWPSRSSYFGLVDLAGFPKDTYYFYQSEWTDAPMLHIFPHWNWDAGDTVDVWAYSNCEEVELYLNGESKGVQSKSDDKLHMVWRLVYVPGCVTGIGRNRGRDALVREVKTAGAPYRIQLIADRDEIRADGQDLSFVTVQILDENGTCCPRADNTVRFNVNGKGFLRATDNGLQTSHESFQGSTRKAFHGKCLAVVQSNGAAGKIILEAVSEGLKGAMVVIRSK